MKVWDEQGRLVVNAEATNINVEVDYTAGDLYLRKDISNNLNSGITIGAGDAGTTMRIKNGTLQFKFPDTLWYTLIPTQVQGQNNFTWSDVGEV